MTGISRRTAIVGIGQTEFSKQSGRSELQLACEAVKAALADAGLAPDDVDGMVTYTVETTNEVEVVRNLGIPGLRYFSRAPYGGGGTCAVVMHAAGAVTAGLAECVVVYRAFNERSERRFGQPQPPARDLREYLVRTAGGGSAQWPAYLVYGLTTPAMWSSLIFQHYMHRYQVTNEDFGRYSVVARAYAATNPDAWFYGKPITIDDHQESRWVVEPVLRLLDCCQETDGGIALVITLAERARDLRQPPVSIVAAAQSALYNGDVVTPYHRPDLARFDDMEAVAAELWRQSGIGVDDIDAAMIYEHFSPIVFMQLEAFGVCGPGEAKDFVAAGNLELDGRLPTNTHGGHLGEAYLHGLNHVTEATRQLRGTAANQLADPEHVLVTAGMSAAILGRPT